MLKTKSIRADVSPTDGERICVMRSYNPHKHKDYKPTDAHLLQLAPSSALLKAYHDGLSWSDYIALYTQEVLIEQKFYVKNLARSATEKDITILCYEDTPDYCHRRILAHACQMYEPSLEVRLE